MLFRKLVVTVTVLISSLTSAFVVKSSCSLSSTWMMSSSTGTIATFDLQRAFECAENTECPIEEVEELRNAIHEKRFQDKVVTQMIGASTAMKKKIEKHQYLEDKLNQQLISLRLEELSTIEGGELFSEAQEEYTNISVDNGDNDITAEQSWDFFSKRVSNNKNDVQKKNPNAFMIMNEYLLESVLIAFLMTFIIYGPVGTIL